MMIWNTSPPYILSSSSHLAFIYSESRFIPNPPGANLVSISPTDISITISLPLNTPTTPTPNSATTMPSAAADESVLVSTSLKNRYS